MGIIIGDTGDNTLRAGAGHNQLYGQGGRDVFVVGHLARTWQTANRVMDFEQGQDKLHMGSYPVWYQKVDTDDDGSMDSTVIHHNASGRGSYTDSQDYPVLAMLKGFTGTLTLDDFVTGGGRPTSVTVIDRTGDQITNDDGDNLASHDSNDTLYAGAGHNQLFGQGGRDIFVVGHLARTWQTANHVMDFVQGQDKLYMGSYPVWYQKIDTDGDGVADATVIYHDATGRGNYADSDDWPVLAILKGFTGTLTLDDFTLGHGRPTSVTAINQTKLGTSGNDVLTGTDGDNILAGLGGNDTLIGGGGGDTMDGGEGEDTASYADSPAMVSVLLTLPQIKPPPRDDGDLRLNPDDGFLFFDDAPGAPPGAPPAATAPSYYPSGLGGDSQGDVLFNIENLIGSRYNDRLVGNRHENVLEGGDGNDWLLGNGGNDTLLGGEGDDNMDGGTGNDTMTGGKGSDRFYVGAANITPGGDDHITDFGFGGDRDTLFVGLGTNQIWYKREDADNDGDTDMVIYADAAARQVRVVLDDYTGALDADYFVDFLGNAAGITVTEIM